MDVPVAPHRAAKAAVGEFSLGRTCLRVLKTPEVRHQTVGCKT